MRAGGFLSDRETVQHPHPSLLAQKLLSDALASLSARKEQVREDFLCSGAMLRDLSEITGPVRSTIFQVNAPGVPSGFVLQLDEPWRIR